MTSAPILYTFRRCPYAIRARLALKYAGMPIAVREVALKHKPAGMLTLSPKGTVPVLQLVDGTVLEESLDIMRWALMQNDAARWLTDDTNEHALTALNDGAFKPLLDRYKYTGQDSGHPVEHYRDEAVDLFVAPLNQRLSQSRYLLGDTPALADMAIVPFIRQFAGVDVEWFESAPLPALKRWLTTLTQSALFASIMTKHASWQPGDPLTWL